MTEKIQQQEQQPTQELQQHSRVLPPYSNPHTHTSPEPSASRAGGRVTRSASFRTKSKDGSKVRDTESKQGAASTRGSNNLSDSPVSNELHSSSSAPPRTKTLLSSPQKRLNHIMSEQKRRNAIRDGYAQLIKLLAPAGAPGLGMPTRGRPKGSGGSGKGKTKGKSGVLFRAVEYVKWLEEGREALLDEVLRAEAAAGIRTK